MQRFSVQLYIIFRSLNVLNDKLKLPLNTHPTEYVDFLPLKTLLNKLLNVFLHLPLCAILISMVLSSLLVRRYDSTHKGVLFDPLTFFRMPVPSANFTLDFRFTNRCLMRAVVIPCKLACLRFVV